MIKSELFDTEEELNIFVSEHNIKIINVETVIEKLIKYDYGISIFIDNKIKLWYIEKTNK